MRVHLVDGRSLTPGLRDRWRALQQSNCALDSPYFCVEFTEAVAQEHSDVEVAVIEQKDETAAFFPFHRRGHGAARPIGDILSDYQGFICAPDFACDPVEILRSCSLVALDFDHLITSQTYFSPFFVHEEMSPVLDLANGFEAYAENTSAVRKVNQAARRLERECGPIRFVMHSERGSDLDEVLKWKSAQYIASGKRDLFLSMKVRATIDRIHAAQSECFSGLLSLLYAGDRMVAGHFGMRSSTVWHYWFPSYDPEYSRYSPGMILLLKMAENACSTGLRLIDLGKGMHLYKERLMNSSRMVAEGSIVRPSWLRIRRKIGKFIRKTPLAAPSQAILRRLRQREY